jgi:hypothetical protein
MGSQLALILVLDNGFSVSLGLGLGFRLSACRSPWANDASDIFSIWDIRVVGWVSRKTGNWRRISRQERDIAMFRDYERMDD